MVKIDKEEKKLKWKGLRLKRLTFQGSDSTHSFMILLVLSYSVFLLVSLILIVFLYFNNLKSTSNEYWMQNEAILQSSINLLDDDIAMLELYTRQIIYNSNFVNLTRMKDNENGDFYFTAMKVKGNFSSYLHNTALRPVDDFYIYLRESGFVLSTNLFDNKYLYYHWKRMFNPDFYEEWLGLLTADNLTGVFYPADGYTNEWTDGHYMYMIDMDTLSYKNIPATICFEINKVKLQDIFSEIPFTDNSFLLVTDDAKQMVFLIGSEEEYLADREALLFPDSDSVGTALKGAGEPMHVTHLLSGENSWHYYLVQPESLSAPPHDSQIPFTLLLVSIGFLGAILIFILSRRAARPLRVLSENLAEALLDKEQLTQEIELQRPIIHHSLVQRILTGAIHSEDELQYIKDFLQLPEEGLQYNVIYAIVYHNEENDAIDAEKTSELVSGVLQHYLKDIVTRLYIYTPKERSFAAMLALEEGDNQLMVIQEKVLKLHDYLLEEHDIWLFAGIGSPSASLMNVWESYQQAQDATNYTGQSYIFLPYEMIKKDSSTFYYPSELSTKLIHFVTSGSKQQTIALFQLIHKENIIERSLPVNMLRFLLSDIRNTLLKARFTISASASNEELKAVIDHQFEDHLSFKLCEDIALNLCEIFSQNAETTDIIGSIENYIKLHYMDPSLGLNKISDEFKISESYFSHLFKERCGVNFSTYLEDIRLSEAARRINEDDSNISQLYLEVGYNNPSSFRRAFKKKFGVVPSSLKKNI